MSLDRYLQGPVSLHLAAEVLEKIRRHRVVIWFDPTRQYTEVVQRLQQASATQDVSFPVVAFSGSFLAMMLALEHFGDTIDPPMLLLYLPGLDEELVKKSPLQEVVEVGYRYQKDCSTLLQEVAAGKVRVEPLAERLQQGPLSLAEADRWLEEQTQAPQSALGSQLALVPLPALLDDLIEAGPISQKLTSPHDRNILWEKLRRATGITETWSSTMLPRNNPRSNDLAFAVASWSLCVEYIDDLQRPPVDTRLQEAAQLLHIVHTREGRPEEERAQNPSYPLVQACRQLAVHLRQKHPRFYAQLADDTEALLAQEISTARAQDLGEIDTFRFEDDNVLQAALQALQEKNWKTAYTWSTQRLDGKSFWLQEDIQRLAAWQLIRDAAALGQAIQKAGPLKTIGSGLGIALEAYKTHGAAVDQAHRHLEQRRNLCSLSHFPSYEKLIVCLNMMRHLWREWADSWAVSFNKLCREHGFLPEPSLQQRTLFEDVVRPLTKESGCTAFFVIDAFRYEMAEELMRAINAETATTRVVLQARLAELPTVTEVGMNVLAPVFHSGKLRPKLRDNSIVGFQVGNEYLVSDPSTRGRTMHERIGGARFPWKSLEEVNTCNLQLLREDVAHARLFVVHSQELDQAGEKGFGLIAFDHTLNKLRHTWQRLREAGVQSFVFTADHGFLLLDETSKQTQPQNLSDKKRRYVFSQTAADHKHEARVSFAELSYDGLQGYCFFPETTAVFDLGRSSKNFVHGGNSLQERVIPVLTLQHRVAVGGSTVQYVISAEALERDADTKSISGTLLLQEHALSYGAAQEREICLRVLDGSQVRVELLDTKGGARIASGSLFAKIAVPFEVSFRLVGSSNERVQLQLADAHASPAVTPATIETRFEVSAARIVATPSLMSLAAVSAPATASRNNMWQEKIEDANYRAVFVYLFEHNSINEDELAKLLGSTRLARRFGNLWASYRDLLPFGIRVDTMSGGTIRYVKET